MEEGLDSLEQIDEQSNIELRERLGKTEMELNPVDSDSDDKNQEMGLTKEQKRKDEDKQRALRILETEVFQCVICQNNMGMETFTLLYLCGDQACDDCARVKIKLHKTRGQQFHCPYCQDEVHLYTKMKIKPGNFKKYDISLGLDLPKQ